MRKITKILIALTLVTFIGLGAIVVSYLKDQVNVQVSASDTAEVQAQVQTTEDETEVEAEVTTETESTTEIESVAETITETAKTDDNKSDTESNAKKPAANSTESERPASNTTAPAATQPSNQTTVQTTTESQARTEHTHNWVYVVDTAAYDEDIYEDKPVYEEQPVYEQQKVGTYIIAYWTYGPHKGEVFYDSRWGTYKDPCSARIAYEEQQVANDPNYPSDSNPSVWCATGDVLYNDYETVQTGTKQVQVGTERVKTGTKHHDEVGHYECSECGVRQ
ncbi:MAG: hypothetical protein IJ763_04885 [Lachnospiraceae bacterium]|nr:hypothetical protein [Lachnospiraceae bacterium]